MTNEPTPWKSSESSYPMEAKTKTLPLRGQPTQQTVNPRAKQHPITDAERQRILDAYTDGLSIKGIERTFHHAKQTVRRVLATNGTEIRADGFQAKITREQLERCRVEGWTPRQIADAYEMDIRTVHHRLRKLGTPVGRAVVEPPIEDVVAAYETGASIQSLADVHGTSYQAVRRALVAGGVVIRSRTRPLVSKYKLADYCRRGFSVGEIAAETGHRRKTISKYLDDVGLRAADKRPGRERPASATLGGVL